MKNPAEYTNADLITYRKILLQTNVHKRSFDPNEQIKVHNSNKYKFIIEPLFRDLDSVEAVTTTSVEKSLKKDNKKKHRSPQVAYKKSMLNRKSESLIQTSTPKRKGGFLSPFKIARFGVKTDYVYWDDPNELVERLRLLIAEQSAGNLSHTNEIHSIIEELREGKYIY